MKKKKLLVVPVGLNCSVVVASFEKNKPDYTYFVCTEQSRKLLTGKPGVCNYGNKETSGGTPNILQQCDLNDSDQFDVCEISFPDDIEKCIQVAVKIFEGLRKEFSTYEIVIDLTPATKSMALAMYNASFVYPSMRVSLITAKRVEGEQNRVVQGTEEVNPQSRNLMFSVGHLYTFDKLLKQYDHDSVCRYIDNLSQEETGIETWLSTKFRYYMFWCRVFISWDKFDHTEALRLFPHLETFKRKGHFKTYLEQVCSQKQFLASTDTEMDKSGVQGSTELVWDLLFNAERRAVNGRYDDAVARLYRALELLMQMRLKLEYGIHTAKVKPELLPEALAQKFCPQGQAVKLALVQGYELLAALDDELGKAWQSSKTNLMGQIEHRSASILAHGVKTVDEIAYELVDDHIGGFIREQCEKLYNGQGYALQFPQSVGDVDYVPETSKEVEAANA